MGQVFEAPAEVELPGEDEVQEDRPWVVVVWNDPVNLMTYVTYVFQKLFGYAKPKAEKLMLQVHEEGKAAVSTGTREKAEADVARLHAPGSGPPCSAGLMLRHPFRPVSGGGYRVRLGRDERDAVRELCRELRTLVAADAPDVARLFPPAFRDDDEAAAEFEELTRDGLEAERLAAFDTVARTIDADRLDEAEASAWCGALNDVRLVLGERLEVTDELYVHGDSPRRPARPRARVLRLAHVASGRARRGARLAAVGGCGETQTVSVAARCSSRCVVLGRPNRARIEAPCVLAL